MRRLVHTRAVLLAGACVAGAAAAVFATLLMANDAGAAPTCTIYWTGSTSTSWSTASNWSLSDGGPSAGGVPGAGDYVCMSTAPTRSSVIASSANRTINGINFAKTATVTPALELQGSTFTVNTNVSTVNNLTLDGGTLTGSAPLTLTGAASMPSSSAVIAGSGVKTVATGATFAQNAQLVVGATTANGVTQLVNNGTYTLAPNVVTYLSTQASGTGSSLSNTGNLTISDSAYFAVNGSGAKQPSLLNSGTLTNAGVTSVLSLSVPFTNTGTVVVGATDLYLAASNAPGTSDTGTWDTSGAGRLHLSVDRSISGGSITGASGVSQDAGTTTYGASVSVSKLSLEGGTVAGSPTVITLIGDSGTLNGTGALTATGAASTLCSVTISGGYTLVNSGTLGYVHDCGNVYLATGGAIKNTGTLAVTGTACCGTIYDDGAANDALLNSGTLTVTLDAAASPVTISTPFTNTGAVTVTTGQLVLSDGNAASSASDTGTYSIGAKGVLELSGGNRSLASGTVSGAGTLDVAGGSVTMAPGVTVSNLDLEGGTVSGSPSVVTATLDNGTLDGSGTMTLTGASSTICNPTIQNGYTLANSGTLTFTRDCGNVYLANASTITNSGTFSINGSSCCGTIYDDGIAGDGFLNSGSLTLALDASSSAVAISTPFTNTGTITATTGNLTLNDGNTTAHPSDSGTYAIAAAGSVTFAGGTRTVASGTSTGAGPVIVSNGTVSFGSGVALSNLDVESGTVSGSPTTSTLTLDGGSLDGAGVLTATGAGSTLCNPTLSGGYTLVNQGTLTYKRDCGNLFLSGGSALKNTGTLAVTGTGCCGTIYDDGDTGDAVLNSGTLSLALDASASTFTISTQFTNTGSVVVTQGQLSLDHGNAPSSTSDSGTWSISAGSLVNLAGGARTLTPTGAFTGAGTLVVSGATATFGSSEPVANLDVESGTVSGSPTVGNATLSGGLLQGSGTLTATGASSKLCGPQLDGGYRVINSGTMTYSLTGCHPYLTAGSVLENSGTLNVSGSSGYVQSDGNASNLVVNDSSGTISVTLASVTTEVDVYAPFTNNGTLTVAKGKAVPQSGVTNLSPAGKLTGGTWIVNGGTIVLPNAVTNNAATIVLGASGSFSPALTTLATNSGSLSVGQNLTESVALVNSGAATATAGTWRVNSLTQSAGSLTVQSGAIFKSGATGTGAVAVNAGALSGSGTVQGAVSGAGTVSPGSSGAGTLTVTGTYATPAAGTFAVTAGGTQAAVSGTASLAGTLAITTPSTVPPLGTVVTALTAGSVTGTFATVTGQDVPSAGAFWLVKYNAGSVTLALTPYPTASVANVSTAEGNAGTTTQTFTVTVSAPSQQVITVGYATSDATATAGSDYTATSGTLTFAPGQTTQTVSVAVSGDTLYERDETYGLTLSAPSHATLGTAAAIGTISNDDTAPVVSIGNASASVYGAAGDTLSFPVTLSTASGVAASVNYATADGSALAGTDYTATSGTLTIPAGATTATITVTALPRATYAAPKSLAVNLSAPVDATLGTASATGTITNINDAVTSITPKGQVFTGTTKTLTLNGVNFAAGSTVSVSGSGVLVSSVTVVDAQTITAKFFAQATAPTGLRTVTVASPGHGSAACANCLRVSPTPTATAVSPNVIPRGTSTPVALTITGTNFATGAKVSFVPNHGMIVAGGSTNVVSSTTITVSVTAKQYAALGLYKVNVTNPDSGLASCAGCLSVQGPAISSVSPNVIRRGVPTTITISGSAFDPAAVVSGTACATTTNSVTATSISATVSCGTNAPLGRRSVTVTNPDGGAYTCTNCLNLGGPNITAISPASVQRGTTTNLTITGTGFANGATLAITGTCTFSAVTVTGPTGMTATISCPSTAGTGTKQLTVTNPASAGSGVGVYNGFSITA